MATVTVGSEDYTSLIGLDEADAYLGADVNAVAYREGTEDERARWLVTATRILLRQSWRAGIVLADVVAIQEATAELAAQIAGGYDAANRSTTASNIARQKAGSVEVEYFRGVEGDGLRLPLPVWELIRPYLAGSAGLVLGGALASGTDGCSITGRGNPYDYGWIGQSLPDRDLI